MSISSLRREVAEDTLALSIEVNTNASKKVGKYTSE
jgi:hypothetical protein